MAAQGALISPPTRREGLQRVLVRAKLLLPPTCRCWHPHADWGCPLHGHALACDSVAFAEGVSMKNGDALRSSRRRLRVPAGLGRCERRRRCCD